jgi:hypothetical protein
LTFPAAAQTSVGRPHKQINQLGGAKVVANPVVAPSRAATGFALFRLLQQFHRHQKLCHRCVDRSV